MVTRKQRERKLSYVQLREHGWRACIPHCLAREKKLPSWQLDEELLHAMLHPGYPITVLVNLPHDGEPSKLILSDPSLDPRLHDRWLFNPNYTGSWADIVATNPELFREHFRGPIQCPKPGTTPTMTTMAVVVEYMANQDLFTALEPSLWPLVPNAEYYWQGAKARDPHGNSEIKLSFNKCPLWRVWGANLEYAYTTNSCFVWAMGSDVSDYVSLKVGCAMQLSFVRGEGRSYRWGSTHSSTRSDSDGLMEVAEGLMGRGAARAATTTSSSSSKPERLPPPRCVQDRWDSKRYSCRHCSSGDLCRPVGGPVNEDHRLLYQAAMDEAAMTRGSDIPEVIPPVLGKDYIFQPVPKHLEQAAAAAGAAGLPGLMDWGLVAVVMRSGRWTFNMKTPVAPGGCVTNITEPWWTGLTQSRPAPPPCYTNQTEEQHGPWWAAE